MRGNIPIPELPEGEEVWLALTVAVVRRRYTQQGYPFYDAKGYNSAGSIPLRAWSETIELCGELSAGLWRVTGAVRDRQFVLTRYEPIDRTEYLSRQGSEPVLPQAYVLDIETLTLPGYRERAAHKLERRYRIGEMNADQRERYLADRQAEEERAYRAGSLSGASGRVLSIAVQIGAQPEFVPYTAAAVESEHVFGIDNQGLEQPEQHALTGFLNLMRRFRIELDEIVGHNIAWFDLPFIYQRCLVLGIPARPTLESTGYNVFDTMRNWGLGDRRNIALDDISWALGIESSKTPEVEGSRIYELYQNGRLADIRDYNLRDVRLTRKIYDRMISFLGR
ncbi:MAG TPA: ribonuclease H-like domain-containing protein [Blastocatellia bacterium]|nr:ribonuclease H-like domain-containing protein [Blastocatellia bacterium]